LKLTIDECVQVGPAQAEQPLMVLADLCSDAEVTKIVDTTIAKFGRLDILVNNAGTIGRGTIESTSMKQYDRIMSVNVRSAFHLTMLCVPHLIETRGNIVNVSSVMGTRPVQGFLVYCMSKSALNMMTSSVGLELASKGVRVNCVNPGLVNTNLFQRAALASGSYEQYHERMKARHPLGRLGEPEEIAQAIAFLASRNASFVTGEHFYIDGGMQCAGPR